jgi:hypothetical protein
MRKTSVLHHVLYIDESEWGGKDVGAKKKFQLAGFWAACQSEKLSHLLDRHKVQADHLIAKARVRSKFPAGDEFHATEVSDGELYGRVCEQLFSRIPPDWHPVRIVNWDGIRTGDPVLDYTLLVGHLYVKVLQQIRSSYRDPDDEIVLHLVFASVLMELDINDYPIFLDHLEYERRSRFEILHEHLRQSGEANPEECRIGTFVYASGDHPVMQICDWISNASFNRCRERIEPMEILNRRLNTHDFDLSAFNQRIDDQLRSGRLGDALVLIAGASSSEKYLPQIVEKMASLRKRDRDTQIQIVVASWAQRVEAERDPNALDTLGWYEKSVIPALLAAVPDEKRKRFCNTVAHWQYSLHLYSLSCANHSGNLLEAENHAKKLRELVPALAGRWEHIGLLIEGMTRVAVHMTDLLRFGEANQLMQRYSDFLEETGGLFSGVLEEIPERVRSDLRGKTLGTAAQSLMFLGLETESAFEEARNLNDMAMQEFEDNSDIDQTLQYRANLETNAGDLDQGRRFLAKSLGLSAEATHLEIGNLIASLDSGEVPQGFAILHWLRIASRSTQGQGKVASEIYSAWKGNKALSNNPWVLRKGLEYPAHGIRRYLAVLQAHRGASDDAESTLLSFRELNKADGKSRSESHVDELIWTAAQIETAVALLGAGDLNRCKNLLETSKADWSGALPRLRSHLGRLQGLEPLHRFKAHVEELIACVEKVLPDPGKDATAVLELDATSRRIPW